MVYQISARRKIHFVRRERQVFGPFRGVEKVRITLDGLPQLMLRIATAPAVLPASVIVPVRVAHGAQVAGL
jgi:hypothetical protein